MSQIVEWLGQLLAQVRGFLAAMPWRQRAMFLGFSAGFVLAFGAFVWWASRPIYDSVFANLEEPDAAAIVEYLRNERIPYRLEHGGRAVLVPREHVYDVRLALARAGLPQGSGVGFEIFDEQKLGMTDFVQRLNYTRALQGELSRTIAQISGVSAARVHLALPERSVFVSEERRPSASVVLTLAPGRAMGAGNVAGIVHLVASSVEGLSPDDVTIVDSAGRVLAGEKGGLEASGVGHHVLEYQQALEGRLEERIESMLGRVVGPEKVNARVSVLLDLTRVETTEERVDPDRTAVSSERLSREESSDARAAGGVPGVASNLTNEEVPEAAAGTRSERRDESVTYEVSKVTSRSIGSIGEVERLSVAVLIDGTYERGEGGARFVPRPQEELERYTELVKRAVGFSEERGDRVEVASVPFTTPAVSEEGWLETARGLTSGLAAYLPRLLGVLLLLVFFLSVVRPALGRLSAQAGPGRVTVTGHAVLPDLDGLVQRLGDENRRLTTEDPERAAYLVRQWLQTRDA
jgi:flagellar M-ring protein FliF